jgi:hypothetical protein
VVLIGVHTHPYLSGETTTKHPIFGHFWGSKTMKNHDFFIFHHVKKIFFSILFFHHPPSIIDP